MADSKLSKAVLKEQLADDFDAVFSPQGSAAMVEKLRSVPISDGPQYIEKAEKIADYRIIDKLAQRWLRHEPAPFVEKLVQELGGFVEEELFADNLALRALAPETQDFILTLADRIRSIRLTERADAQAVTSIGTERIIPALPTAADFANDPKMTWAGRDKEQRIVGEDGVLRKENPLDFVRRVYAPWLGHGLTLAQINIDPSLYMGIMNWMRGDEKRKAEVSDMLPQGKIKYVNQHISMDELSAYKKVNAIRHSVKRKKTV